LLSELYDEGSFPIGLVAEATFTSTRAQLEPDDTLLLFTDGVTEAEDKNRNLFESERLIDALHSMPIARSTLSSKGYWAR
jgi:sigma-B regulation protein RsbU (phosphoserine phosphatase)